MARPHIYTPRRRLILQFVMILVLAGTLGLAALVRQVRPGGRFDAPVALGMLKIRMPAGWKLVQQLAFGLPAAGIVRAEEPDEGLEHKGRQIQVTQQLVAPETTLEAYFEDSQQISVAMTGEIEIAGAQGVTFVRVEENAKGNSAIHLYAAAILPQGLAVTVQVIVTDRSVEAADQELLQEVAKHIRIRPGESELEP